MPGGCPPFLDCIRPPRRVFRIVLAPGGSRGHAARPLLRPDAALRPGPSAWSAPPQRRPERRGRLGSSNAPNGTGVSPVQPAQGIIPPAYSPKFYFGWSWRGALAARARHVWWLSHPPPQKISAL
ncbi:hypothetical protein NDU88_005558 [Pleurodeles waltl]|uniref:Uncharacterized protein n=1 Tax=Pleurodeles waltl TaxID=8319 RepID=A0AAV7SMA1_PLEWA|nr:hypothetical protein NDU88_005558 [Pleurodeles waltl]